MSSDTGLKFGPEWMRLLSHGGGTNNNTGQGHPAASSILKGGGKLLPSSSSEHRYTREKMLELCVRVEVPPESLLNDPAAICGDPECTVPLAYTTLTQEEQRSWQRNINSESAVRLLTSSTSRGGAGVGGGHLGGSGGGMGGGGANGGGGGGLTSLGSGRGGRGIGGGGGSNVNGSSMDRGRGRSRGGSNSGGNQYYMRGVSYEEDGDAPARGSNGGGSRDVGPPGIAMRRGGLSGYERSTSLSSGLGSLSSGGGDGRNSAGAWGVPPNISGDHTSATQMGGYHVSQAVDHSRGSVQGDERMSGASSPRKEQGRASTDNWRSRDMSAPGSGGGLGGVDASTGAAGGQSNLTDHWRTSGGIGGAGGVPGSRQTPEKWGTNRGSSTGSNGWRPRDSLDDCLGGGGYGGVGGGYSTNTSTSMYSRNIRGAPHQQQRSRNAWDATRRNWPEDDRLPEWATDICHEAARGGSFDASGAFHSPAWSGGDDDYIPSGNSGGNGLAGGGGSFLSMAGGGSILNTVGRTRPKGAGVGGCESAIVTGCGSSASAVSSSDPSDSSAVCGNDIGGENMMSAGANSAEGENAAHRNSMQEFAVLNGVDVGTDSQATPTPHRLSDSLEHTLQSNGPSDGRLSNAMMNGYCDESIHDGSNSPLILEGRGGEPSNGGGDNTAISLHGSGGSVASSLNIINSTKHHEGLVSHVSVNLGHTRSSQYKTDESNNFSNIRSNQFDGTRCTHASSTSPPISSNTCTLLNSSTVSNSISSSMSNSLKNVSSHGSLTHNIADSSIKDGRDQYREEDLEHMQSVADDLVSKLVDEDPQVSSTQHSRKQQQQEQQSHLQQQQSTNLPSNLLNSVAPGNFLPLSEHTQMQDTSHKWFYTDPQQEVQGPFTSTTMTSWYNSGYFPDTLLLRRDCDDKFAKLGDLTRVFGRVPFLPGPPVPPLKLDKLRDSQEAQAQAVAEKERQQKHSAELEAYKQALREYEIKKSIYEQQNNLRQSQVLQTLSGIDGWNTLTTAEKQDLFLRQLLLLPTLPEPTPPTCPTFLLSTSPTTSTSNINLSNLLNIPPNLQQQLTQATAPPSSISIDQQQQHPSSQSSNGSSTLSPASLLQSQQQSMTNITLSSPAVAPVTTTSGDNAMDVVRHLQQQFQLHSRLPTTNSGSSLLQQQQQQQLAGTQQARLQQPLGPHQSAPARDPIQDLVEQMVRSPTTQDFAQTQLQFKTLALLQEYKARSLQDEQSLKYKQMEYLLRNKMSSVNSSNKGSSTLVGGNLSMPGTCSNTVLQQLQVTAAAAASIGNKSSYTSLPLDMSSSMLPLENPLQQLLMNLQRGPAAPVVCTNSSGGDLGHNRSVSSPVVFPVSSPLQQRPLPAASNVVTAASELPPLQGAGVQAGAPGLPGQQPQQRQQEDVIQSFMQELTKRHQQGQQPTAAVAVATTESQEILNQLNLTEENQRVQQLQQQQPQQQNKKAEEEKKKADSLRLKKEQEEAAAAKKKYEEELKKKEEQKKKELEEELKKKALENKRKEEEKKNKQKLKNQEDANRRQEEKRRQHEEENKRRAEEKKREQAAREAAEQQRQQQEEMRRNALEEERKRMHQIEQEEMAKQQLQQQEQEAARLLQQQAAWGASAAIHTADKNGSQNTPSLIKIQKLQQEKERLERERWLKEEETRKQEAQREAAEKKKATPMTLKWAAKQGGGGNNVKSLLQIQAEEEKEMKKRQTREQQESKAAAAAVSSLSGPAPQHGSGAGSRGWGGAAQPLSWASRASSNAAAPPPAPTAAPAGALAQQNAKSWNESISNWNISQQQSSGFWDFGNEGKLGAKTAASVIASRAPAKPASSKTGPVLLQQQSKQNKTAVKQNITNKINAQANHNNNNNNNKAAVALKKKVNAEELVKKIFNENTGNPVDEFTKWCSGSLTALKVSATVDVPTFVNFLADVESPYDVHDYIRSYLGDTREVKDFAKNYLEKRSQVLNATRCKTVLHDDILAPAPAINPSSEGFQDGKNRKQKSKKKMQKVDSSILGFSVNAKDRVNGDDNNVA